MPLLSDFTHRNWLAQGEVASQELGIELKGADYKSRNLYPGGQQTPSEKQL